MVEWFLALFSGDDAQVRLVLVVSSTLAAVLVVLMNQGFNNRRQSQVLRVDKLEALYDSASEFERIIWSSVYAMERQKELFSLRVRFQEKFNETATTDKYRRDFYMNAAINKRDEIKELSKEININFLELRTSYQRIIMLRDLHFSGIKFDAGFLGVIEEKYSMFREFLDEEQYIDDLKVRAEYLEIFPSVVKSACTSKASSNTAVVRFIERVKSYRIF